MRRVIALALGLVLSTLLLGGGWFFASLRERDGRMREAEIGLMRSADLVVGAVDESLEELRAREDERPFYLYNHFYSPPDVLAISDPVAISPLAHAPGDGRIVGHFQIEPEAVVRTPYTADDASAPELARQITARLRDDALAPLFELALGDLGSTMLGQGRDGRREQSAALDASASSAIDDQLADRSEGTASDNNSGPLTLALNDWGNQQAQEIVAAQSGDYAANRRLLERGRQVPRISRRDVGWDEAEEERTQRQRSSSSSSSRPPSQAAPTPPRAPPGLRARPSLASVRRALEALAPAVASCAPSAAVVARLRLRGSDGRPETVAVDGLEDEGERECARQALRALVVPPFSSPIAIVRYAFPGPGELGSDPEVTDAVGLDNMVRREAEVTYTPMVYRELGEALVLHRVVSHEGVSVVQGLLLDRAHIAERWIPAIVARHADAARAPSVVRASEGACALRRPASRIVRGVELCFGPAALAAATRDLDVELRWQLGGLASLWLIALLAGAAIVSAARRAEALSRQKSAFVSAVSHELRTPLTTLRMHAEMLDEDLVTEERRPKVHRELVRESVRLARLVDNVLSLSKLEEGRRRLHRTEGDLGAHVREVVAAQRDFVEERGFTLAAPTPEAPVRALYDDQAVEQIVVNLLDNAVKYGAGAERAIEVWVGLRDGAPSLAVRDRGPGIPEAERQRVFERFHRVEREEHAHAPGTGIGLALVAELAEAHGGRASVHPRAGGGVELRVTLGASSPG